VDGERIYGDGVNIAARMEALAEGGGICVSGNVFEQVKGKVSVNFEDLGLQQVKNIAESIRAYRAVLGSGTVSAGPQQKVEVPRQDLREGSDLYNTKLMARLSPVMYKGIKAVLDRNKKKVKSGGGLNFSVSVVTGGLIRYAASTRPGGDLGRQRDRKIGEGIRGFFTKALIAGYMQTSLHVNSANRAVFDQFGKQIGEIPVSRNPGSGEKWAYCRPIFEESTSTPWSRRIIGNLLVHSSDDDADSLFKTKAFQAMVDSIATEVSPYLDAIQVLMGDEKL